MGMQSLLLEIGKRPWKQMKVNLVENSKRYPLFARMLMNLFYAKKNNYWTVRTEKLRYTDQKFQSHMEGIYKWA